MSSCTAPGRKRRFFPDITHLESRSLLAVVVTFAGQNGQDLVGPDASQGSDGIQDLDLHLSNLPAPVSRIAIQAPGGFEWATAPDANGAALAEYFASSAAGQGDVYINPQVKSDLPPSGGTLPLGGSTGNLIQLSSGAKLTVTVAYQGQSSSDTVAVTIANLASGTLPVPAVPTPANPLGGFLVTDAGQDGTGQTYELGYVHLVVTAPGGVTFSSASFNAIVWRLSDQAGIAWDSTNATLGHNHIYATIRTGANNVADLYFAPERNEAQPSGSSVPTMLLGVALPNDGRVFATAFSGQNWSLAARTDPLNLVSAPNPPPTTEAQLRADLESTTPEFDTINLPANTTIVITQPLEITHSVKIVGNNATLLFRQGNTASWPSAASGAIYVDAPTYTNIQVQLSDFTITFDQTSPIRWSNPPGAGPALFDPNNNPGGVQHAVIDTRDSNTNLNMTLLTLNAMTVLGPRAFDGSAFSSLQAQLAAQGDSTDQYVGEQDIELIRTNDQDTGSIMGSTFRGGSIELFAGPWTIAGNNVLGSTAFTYSPGAFAMHSPHDVLIEGNQVSQADPNGHEFRLVVMSVSGYGDTIQGNSFGGGAGQVGDELGYSATSSQFGGINDPEVILAESTYGVLFEGRPGAISNDGRLLVLPHLRADAYAGFTGPGLVVSILAGVNHDGSANMGLAGTWYTVAQQASLSAGNTITLMMQDPLPAMPQGGYYIVEVTGGFVNNAFVDNTIDLLGKSSTGIVINGEDYHSVVIGNTFKGGSVYQTVYTGTAISLGAAIASAPSGSGPFPLPAGWTALPDLGAIVDSNTIIDSVGGIVIGVQHAANYWGAAVASTSETGRVFVTASVSRNTFEFDSSFLSSWAASYLTDGNDPAESSRPPTITIGAGFSGEAPGPYGSPRFPWTVGNAINVNANIAPIFVDPTENVVTVWSNSVQLMTAGGGTPQPTLSGQVYDGIVNGAVVAPRITPTVYNGLTYYPFNLANLDISPLGAGPSQPPPKGAAPPAPTGVSISLTGLNQVEVSWQSSPGATSYVVELSLDGLNWSAIAGAVTSNSFAESGLEYATTYDYRVLAVSSAGNSAPSSAVAVTTLTLPDVLTVHSLIIKVTSKAAFTAPIAQYTDANTAAAADSFIATIKWGDGRSGRGVVSGNDGAFVVTGTHKYAKAGVYRIVVTVTMKRPGHSGASARSAAQVVSPVKHRQTARPIPGRPKKVAKAAKRRIR
jgi:hypothetical protein